MEHLSQGLLCLARLRLPVCSLGFLFNVSLLFENVFYVSVCRQIDRCGIVSVCAGYNVHRAKVNPAHVVTLRAVLQQNMVGR